MSLADFAAEQKPVLLDALQRLHAWIHANPTATAAAAQTAVRNFFAANYTGYMATTDFADKFASRVLSVVPEGTWVAFRTMALKYRAAVRVAWAREVYRAATE